MKENFIKCPNSLLEKIHIPKHSGNCRYFFASTKIGSPVVKAPKSQADFIFFNNSENPTPEYNSLYDPNLKRYFSRKDVLNHLRKNKFITDDNEIVCSLRAFNDIRKRIHRLQTEQVSAEQKRDNVSENIKHRVNESDKMFKRMQENKKKFVNLYGTEDSLKNPINFKSVVEIFRRRKMEKEMTKRTKYLNAIKKYNLRLQKIEYLKNLNRNELKERGLYRNLEITKKRIAVIEKEQEKNRKLKRKIYERELKLQEKYRQQEPRDCVVKCPIPLQ